MKIAIFDYIVSRNAPAGSCHRILLEQLSDEHDFTVYAREFDNPNPKRIRFVHVPSIRKPLFLFFISFLIYSLRFRKLCAHSDIVQGIENYCLFPEVSYVHFCHRAFLKRQGSLLLRGGVRGWIRYLDHALRTSLERVVYRRAKILVVPSIGLRGELIGLYPELDGKVRVIPNPIDMRRMTRPDDFNRRDFRKTLGFSAENIVLSFSALGHFERKGLPLVLEALQSLNNSTLKLLVIGGSDDLVSQYRNKVEALNLTEQVVFVGNQKEVRPFLWTSDAFVFPSSYETFSLVVHEAAAAGLPILCSDIYGVQDWLKDGGNGIVLEDNVVSVERGIRTFLSLGSAQREQMGHCARESVSGYSPEQFAENWRKLYAGF